MRKFITICAVAVLSLAILAPQSKAGNVVGGTVPPSPGGTGTVTVFGPGFGIITKEFTSIDSITIEFTVANGIPGMSLPNMFSETVTNSTGFEWTDYHFEFVPLAGGDGLYFIPQPSSGPLAQSSSLFNTLAQPNEDTLDWSGGVVTNGGTVNFGFSFYVPDGITSFLLIQHPTVPEPATMCLLGLGALGLLRKRRA